MKIKKDPLRWARNIIKDMSTGSYRKVRAAVKKVLDENSRIAYLLVEDCIEKEQLYDTTYVLLFYVQKQPT